MFLSIVVLSYNRPEQLRRILDNFIGFKSTEVNIVIKDDRSPKMAEIVSLVDLYKEKIDIEIVLHINKNNLGYDLNLIDTFDIVCSDYVFLLSDDDYVVGDKLEIVVDSLKRKNHSVFYTPYIDKGVVKRDNLALYDVDNFSHVIYNSILFSGLIFNRRDVLALRLDLNFLSTCIYSQVYIASLLVYREKSFGVVPAGCLYLGGDGENYFGKNESAINSDVLSDRKKLSADLSYQNFLLRVVDRIAEETSSIVLSSFYRQYRLRLIGYGFRVRSFGFSEYFKFVMAYLAGSYKVHAIPLLSFFVIFAIPSLLAKRVYSYGVRLLRKAG